MDIKIQIPEIPEEELTPTVRVLLAIISQCMQIIEAQRKEIQLLKDEIARLKGRSQRPKIKASKLNGEIIKKAPRTRKERQKRKTKSTNSYQEITLEAKDIPVNAQFKGYKRYTVQDIEITSHTIVYRRECWMTPEGTYCIAPLPEGVRGHYGNALRSYILHLYYELNVPQNAIVNSLQGKGIIISAGQLNAMVTQGHSIFHNEKEDILETGLKIVPYISVDDTGARHQGHNGYCTHIGNDVFSYFKSTNSKSRVNFLRILRGRHNDYMMSQESIDYMMMHRIPPPLVNRFRGKLNKRIATEEEWESLLHIIGIHREHDKRIITEAALLGSILSHGIKRDMVIVSDDAGQFDIVVLLHALCWLHAERGLSTIVPINDYHKKIIEDMRRKVWELYHNVQEYKQYPTKEKMLLLESQFDTLCRQETEFEDIKKALESMRQNKKELLLVLQRPEIPLHNNISENAIRVYVLKRKIHGGTRSELGRECRDTFLSLKKTCRKLDISFYEYILDRLTGRYRIPPLCQLLRERILTPLSFPA